MDRVHGEIHDIACTHYQTTYLHIIVPLVHIRDTNIVYTLDIMFQLARVS